jgi:hypothetical protein
MRKAQNGLVEEIDEILAVEEIESDAPCADYRSCLLHSGVKVAVKYLAKDNDSQWRAINTISNRIWAVLIGVTATFFLVLMQLFFQHINK